MDEKVIWTNLTPPENSELLKEKHQIQVSEMVIRKLLKNIIVVGVRRKKKIMKHVVDRNEQFEKITSLKAEDIAAGNPIISMDAKEKEYNW